MPWSSHNESARGCAEQIERWLEPLHRTALRLTGNRADAEDLVQETCVRACRGWAEVRDQTRTRAWFFQVLRSAWLDQLRKAARRPRLVPMVGSIHSGCWARRSWLICCLSSVYGV